MHFPDFCTIVGKSRLVGEEELRHFIERFREICPECDTLPHADQQFADELRSAGMLTSWQIKMLLEKKYKGFFIGRYKLLQKLGWYRYRAMRDDALAVELVVFGTSARGTHYVAFRPDSFLDEGTE